MDLTLPSEAPQAKNDNGQIVGQKEVAVSDICHEKWVISCNYGKGLGPRNVYFNCLMELHLVLKFYWPKGPPISL